MVPVTAEASTTLEWYPRVRIAEDRVAEPGGLDE
jgi:hypothetical protein